MRRRTLAVGSIIGLVLGAVMLFVPPAGAGDDGDEPGGGGEAGGLPAALDQADIARFLATVQDEFGTDEATGFPLLPDDLDVLQGEPGERDLPESDVPIATAQQQLVAAEKILAAGGEVEASGPGSSLTGPCMGVAWSYAEDGSPLYAAMDFDQAKPPIEIYPDFGEVAFTESNPYLTHVDGTTVYAGVAGGREPGTGPRNHDWYIKIEIGPVGTNLDAGGDPNGQGENRNLGAVSSKEDLPAAAKVNAKARISGRMVADGGFECAGAGYIEFVGGRDLTGPGAALVLISGVGMLFNARPARTFQGVV